MQNRWLEINYNLKINYRNYRKFNEIYVYIYIYRKKCKSM